MRHLKLVKVLFVVIRLKGEATASFVRRRLHIVIAVILVALQVAVVSHFKVHFAGGGGLLDAWRLV